MNVQESLLRQRIDPHLTTDNLTALSRAAVGGGSPATGYSILTGGCWNRVIAVEHSGQTDDLVFKIGPKPHDGSIEREYSVLRYFHEHTTMPVPEPLYLDASGERIPGTVLVMRKVPGEVLHSIHYRLGRRERESVSEQIAAHVIALHEHRSTGFGGVELAPDDRMREWKDFWLPRFDKVIDEVEQGNYVSSAMIREVREARGGLDSILAIGNESTLTHYDIWSGNVMVDHEQGKPKVTGFIDVPGYFADYARELSFMMMFGMADDRFVELYSSRYDFDQDVDTRINLYNLKMHLRHVTMYPTEGYYRQGAEQCLRYVQSRLSGA